MRWDRLFRDLEASAVDAVGDERDALADELRDEQWAELSWVDVLGGEVALTVEGAGEVVGEVRWATPQLLHVGAATDDVVVARDAVLTAAGSRGGGVDLRRVGWGSVFRAAQSDGDEVRLVRRDGVVLSGLVAAVTRDAVLLARPQGRVATIPWTAIAVVRRPR